MNLEINFLGNMRLQTVESDYQILKISVSLKSACNCQKFGLHCTDTYSCSEKCVNGGKEEDTERVELDWEDNVNADLNANFN